MTQPGITRDNVAAHLLERTAEAREPGHVFGLRAEAEGIALAPVIEQLLTGWRAQGYALVPLRAIYEAVEPFALPRCEVQLARVPGRRGVVLAQGPEFLGAVDIH
jgi:hypothetical protein